jgi:predicted outer membrane repeat protein
VSVLASVSFETNEARTTGGAINATGVVSLTFGNFVGNRATTLGGAINAVSVSATGSVTFTDNSAATGGAINATGAISLTGGGTLATNRAIVGSGGAINTAGAVILDGGTFTGNTANTVGGAISAGSVTAAVSVSFDGNVATTSGGAINVADAVTFSNGGNFTNNKADNDNGGAVRSGGNATFQNCLFTGNTSGLGSTTGTTGSGGAVACSGTFDATRCTFGKNEAKVNGGAVYLQSTGIGNRVERCFFTGNAAVREGGALHVANTTSVVSVLRSLFSSNQVTDTRTGGGAVYITGTGTFTDCTFTGNDAGAMFNAAEPIRGGAVYATPPANGNVAFTNCTFTRNRVSSLQSDGMGGALWLSGKVDMLYCTLTDKNEAFASATYGSGFGGGIYVNSGPFSITACAVSGNTANYGDDIFRRENVIINSGGYNRLRYYGIISTALGSPYPTQFSWRSDGNVRGAPDYDLEGITQAAMFGAYTLDANLVTGVVLADLETGASTTPDSLGSSTLTTIRLLDVGSNPARNQIPNREGTLFAVRADQRGVERPQPENGFFDVGAFEAHKDEGAGVAPGPDQEYVDSVKMGGIPNRMAKIDERCTLIATVFPTRASQEVWWDSTVPGVASIDEFGNLRSLAVGNTRIIVRTRGTKPDGQPAVDSADLTVSEAVIYLDVDPGVTAKLDVFSAGMRRYSEEVYLVDADPAKVSAASFQSAFRSLWNVTPVQVTELQNADALLLASKSRYEGDNWVSVKPSMGVSLSSVPNGGLLPLEYVWSMTWDEVSTIMGSPVTRIDSVTALFQKVKPVFQGVDGVATPVIDADGEFGVAASKAESSGALTVENGNNGLTLRIRALMGDIGSAKSAMVDNELVIADGVLNGTAGGDMWLLKRVEEPGDSLGGSGGGGCSAGFGVALLAFAPAIFLKKRDS